LAVANYESAEGHFPPAFVTGPDGRPWHSWRVLVLPYIEGDAIYKAYTFDEPWDGPHNKRLADRMPKVFAFSGTELPATTTNYLAVVGTETMWPGAEGRKRADITDDPSRTILVVENQGLGVHWMEPRDLDFGTMNFTLDTPDGLSSWYTNPAVVTVDDIVRRLSSGMSPDALRAALTVRGGEKLNEGAGGWEVLPQGRAGEEPVENK
jgi:hypothetical protein